MNLYLTCPRDHTLCAVNPSSAKRTLGLIRSGIPSPLSATNLYSIGSDGVTFNSISSEALGIALNELNVDQAALVIGYAMAITSEVINIVELVNREDPISEYGQEQLRTQGSSDYYRL